jgi:hypothetical protein
MQDCAESMQCRSSSQGVDVRLQPRVPALIARGNHSYSPQVLRIGNRIDRIELKFLRVMRTAEASMPRPIDDLHSCNFVEAETAPVRQVADCRIPAKLPGHNRAAQVRGAEDVRAEISPQISNYRANLLRVLDCMPKHADFFVL